jgi:hypothetical protein
VSDDCEDGVVVRGPWTTIAHRDTVRAGWFVSTTTVDRRLTETAFERGEAQRITADVMRASIERDMARCGFVPMGPVEVEQTEDRLRDCTVYRMRQRGIEDTAPVWQAVRAALAADQEWIAEQQRIRDGSSGER